MTGSSSLARFDNSCCFLRHAICVMPPKAAMKKAPVAVKARMKSAHTKSAPMKSASKSGSKAAMTAHTKSAPMKSASAPSYLGCTEGLLNAKTVRGARQGGVVVQISVMCRI